MGLAGPPKVMNLCGLDPLDPLFGLRQADEVSAAGQGIRWGIRWGIRPT